MVLLQQAALPASQYFDHVEIIELHHNQKVDSLWSERPRLEKTGLPLTS
ncbi:hypothetical protein H1P_20053 [Hyella patelloides LEGE 07179]|uniref:Uncharacterized protein n=1 Tax=Hyella patelloides LEGE 07179 TaxID=945734 RepID=A0A563VPQ6_9CYAN|nr:dihydrodipicolinate reductase C-terminal domain-containing protein [Hyella patelloides]VEP13446.1 hypothetical protein H1P_20053 [Hyella patelloides LEGE 07179]